MAKRKKSKKDETEDTYSEYSEIDDEVFVKIKKIPTQLICLDKSAFLCQLHDCL